MTQLANIRCDDLARREAVLAHPTLNGIDYIEVPKDDQQNIRVYFIKPTPPALALGEVKVEGGVRIQNIRVLNLQENTDENLNPYLEVRVDQSGDFSTYILAIESAGELDGAFSRRAFSFKAGCPSDFDCHSQIVCPTSSGKEPLIDYMAKDYASFRQLLVDLIPSKIPDWLERHEADFGIVLAELFAYVGDQLSYYQDAVATEAYLQTARQRESVKRHALLIDYYMWNGINARTFLFIKLKKNTTGTLPQNTAILSKLEVPLGVNHNPPFGPIIPGTIRMQALSEADVVFETMNSVTLDATLNEIKIHTWGNRLCCVPRGSTQLELVGDLPLNKGDFLLLEEVKGPETGLKADADPKHRQMVRLLSVEKTNDPIIADPSTGVPPLKLTRVTWHKQDALRFPLCLSIKLKEGTVIEHVSVARGNLVLADHGRTVEEWHPVDPTSAPAAGVAKRDLAYRFLLQHGPITFYQPYLERDDEPISVQELLASDSRKTNAAASLKLYQDATLSDYELWSVVPNLLDSSSFHRHFVVETKNDGRAMIRFGDGQYGLAPKDGSYIKTKYRIGNGVQGNIGFETLVHILEPESLPANWPDIVAVRNPIPSCGGEDSESLDQVKLMAPKAFHAEQFRAVTEDDYAKAAEKHSEVDKAVADFRWTGSWHTVFVTIDPKGRTGVSQNLKKRVTTHLKRYKLAGYDLEIFPPIYVPLEIEIDVCVARDFFRAHVKSALLQALSNRTLSDGIKGFFHPDFFTFGQPVYLSKLYFVLEQVAGVDSASITLFKRYGKQANGEITQGFISINRLEIAMLDNDPNYPEHGVLRLNMLGGK